VVVLDRLSWKSRMVMKLLMLVSSKIYRVMTLSTPETFLRKVRILEKLFPYLNSYSFVISYPVLSMQIKLFGIVCELSHLSLLSVDQKVQVLLQIVTRNNYDKNAFPWTNNLERRFQVFWSLWLGFCYSIGLR
jgi:hypothetical protein